MNARPKLVPEKRTPVFEDVRALPGEANMQCVQPHCVHKSRLQDALLCAIENGVPDHMAAYFESLLEGEKPTVAYIDTAKLPCRPGSRLTPKEVLVLHLIRQGLPNKGIAKQMQVAPETVKSHVKRIFIKLGARTRAQAVFSATELGLF